MRETDRCGGKPSNCRDDRVPLRSAEPALVFPGMSTYLPVLVSRKKITKTYNYEEIFNLYYSLNSGFCAVQHRLKLGKIVGAGGEHVAGAREADFVTAAGGGRPESDRQCLAWPPIGNLAQFHDIPGVGLFGYRDRGREVDLVTPCVDGRLERCGVPNGFGGRCIFQVQGQRDRADRKAKLAGHGQILLRVMTGFEPIVPAPQ